MLLAVEFGCGYIDVEIEWPSNVINALSHRKLGSKIVASYHPWT
jgi:3-dehydroquinate dehydratase